MNNNQTGTVPATQNNTSGSYSSLKGFHRAVPIILTALGVFTAICFITSGTGALGGAISSVLCGLFSAGAYAIPAILIIHAVFYADDIVKKRLISRIVFSFIAVLIISSIEYTVVFWGQEFVFAPVEFYISASAGGFIGSTVAFALVKMLGTIGVYILSAAIIAIYITFFFSKEDSAAGKVLFAVLGFFLGILALIERGIKKLFGSAKNAKEKKRIKENNKKNQEFLDDPFFTVDNGISTLTVTGVEDKGDRTDISEKTEVRSDVISDTEDAPSDKAVREKRTVSFDYGITPPATVTEKTDDALHAAEAVKKTETPAASASVSSYGLDESADKVFTKDFDPFDFAVNQRFAVKPSSRSVKSEAAGIGEITRPLSSMTNEEIEQEKRRLEFERKKKMIIDMRIKANGASSTPAPEFSDSDKPITDKVPLAAVTKSVEFNINTDTRIIPETPAEGSTFKGTFEKQEYREHDVEKAAAHIAEIVAMNNPAYAKSSNEICTYVKITETPSSHESEPVLAYTSEESSPLTPVFTSGTADKANPISSIEDDTEGSDTPAETVTEIVTETVIEIPSEIKKAESVIEKHSETEQAFVVTEQKETAEIKIAQDTEAITEGSSIFKPYIPHTTDGSETSEVKAEETLVVERTMLSPTSTTERDKKYTVLSDEMQVLSKEEDEDSEEEIAFSLNFDEKSSTTIVKESGTETVTEGTLFRFDDDDEEDDEEDETEVYNEIPEEEAIISEEIPLEDQNPEVILQRKMFPFLDNSPEKVQTHTPEVLSSDEVTEEQKEVIKTDDKTEEKPLDTVTDEDDDEPPFDTDKPIVNSPASQTAAVVVRGETVKEKEKPKKPDYSNYAFPPIDLLGMDVKKTEDNVDEEIQDNADKLIETLASFNVTASIKGVDRGPRITRYEVVPAKGVKVSSVMNLQDDIALGLAAEGIRMEAPIPGKSAIGVEIPNVKEETVRLRELLETEDFVNAASKTTICIGKDVTGQPVINDITKMPHLLIAGATGMGKSVCINSLMISMLYKARPDEVKFIMIDPKQVEFTMYNGIPHLLVPVVSDAKQAAGALMWAVEEMERRYNLLNTHYVRNADAYNEKVKEDPSIGEPMSKIVIVIDEFADLMLQVRDPVEGLVMRIAQKARAAGIHLIIGTQRPAVNVITGTIKANIPSRISCKVASNTDSRTILDAGGAEKLLNKGDMLFSFSGAIKPLRVQGAFVKDSEVEAIMKYLKQFSNGENYDKTVMEEIERAAQKCSKKGSSSDDRDDDGADGGGDGYLNDRQFLDAVELAVNSGKIATSLIQRKLSIGYGKAAKFIDIMEEMGIVGEGNGPKPREVLITADEWREKLARVTLD